MKKITNFKDIDQANGGGSETGGEGSRGVARDIFKKK
jgi:hypothetical protein